VKVRKISGSQKDIIKRLMRVTGISQYKPFLQDQKTLYDAYKGIRVDITRTPFIGSSDEQDKFTDFFLNHHSKNYSQGDHAVRTIPDILFAAKFNKVRVNMGEQMGDVYLDGHSKHFAYINNEGLCSGYIMNYYKSDPSLWIVATVENTNGKINERPVNLYFSESAYAKLGKFRYDEVSLVDDLKTQINKDEIYKLVRDVVKENGEVDHEKVQAIEALPFSVNEKKFPYFDSPGDDKTYDVKRVYQSLFELHEQAMVLQKKEGKLDQAKIAFDFIEELTALCDSHFNQPEASQRLERDEFKKDCIDLVKDTQVKLPYEGWDRLLVNVFLAIVMLGVFYAAAGYVKYKRTGNFWLYNPQNKAEKRLDPVRESFEALNIG